MGTITAMPGGHGYPASGRNPTNDLMTSYGSILRRRQEQSTRNQEYRPRWRQSANGTWITETAQEVETGGQAQQEPDHEPELCCICMGEAASHSLEPCNHSGFCGTCAMLLTAGAVSDTPRCPICRADITGYHEAPASTTAVSTAALPTQPLADIATSVEEAIAPDILSILRSPISTGTGMPRTAQFLQQLQAHRSAQHHLFTDLAWERYNVKEEPLLLVDTGAKDGLCGDKWAIHSANWAGARGEETP